MTDGGGLKQTAFCLILTFHWACLIGSETLTIVLILDRLDWM